MPCDEKKKDIMVHYLQLQCSHTQSISLFISAGLAHYHWSVMWSKVWRWKLGNRTPSLFRISQQFNVRGNDRSDSECSHLTVNYLHHVLTHHQHPHMLFTVIWSVKGWQNHIDFPLLFFIPFICSFSESIRLNLFPLFKANYSTSMLQSW